jgi:hypothetical protein
MTSLLHYARFPLFCLMALSSLVHAGDRNCDLVAPPKSAAINSVHGYFIFMFPRNIASNYTGCRTIWGEKGEVFMTVKYKSGLPYTLTQFDPEDRKPVLECRYKNKALAAVQKGCPSYARMVEDAAREWPPVEESQLLPLLRPEQDPRRD